MHELAVTQSLLKLAVSHAEEAKATRVTDLYLEIGQLSSYVDDSVQFYWDLISKGSVAEGATLHFHRVPMELECRDCNRGFRPTGDGFECPYCKSEHVQVVSGDVFQLVGLDVEKPRTKEKVAA